MQHVVYVPELGSSGLGSCGDDGFLMLPGGDIMT